jgi:hypothetical protein
MRINVPLIIVAEVQYWPEEQNSLTQYKIRPHQGWPFLQSARSQTSKHKCGNRSATCEKVWSC